MRPAGRHSLRRRLLATVMTVIVLAGSVLAATAWRSALRQADEMFDYHLQQMAHALRGGIPLAPPTLDANGSDEYLVQIWGPDGVQLFRSVPTPLPPRAVLGFSDARLQGVHYRVYTVQTPYQTIQIAQNLDARQARARALALRATLPMALMAPLLMLLAWWGISRSLAPLERARAEVALRAADDLSPLQGAGLPDEVRPLVEEINLLFGRLDQAFTAQRAFVANAAHELRSPLAALKLQAQAVERAADAPGRGLALARLHQGIDRAIRLMQQLLLLARQEAAAQASTPLPPLALAPLVRQAVADALPQAQARGIDLGLETEGDEAALPPVRGDADALAILLRNLLDNAIKYSPPQGRIDVVLGPHLLAVHDSGPGIAAPERERVFERFYRSPDAQASGSGLGLTIARTIAERHGATLRLDSSPRLGGLLAALHFAPDPAA
ncbi:ATP-binding protein [Pseudorhodoferax sp.]|uniref:ATP-binding protein n=1 Tax=Pseudorhodoferax sp. TaxID=1993553 RepID=UPI002DD622BA|nr:ATP-binding protein [Pseudorhodoferax sp.]